MSPPRPPHSLSEPLPSSSALSPLQILQAFSIYCLCFQGQSESPLPLHLNSNFHQHNESCEPLVFTSCLPLSFQPLRLHCHSNPWSPILTPPLSSFSLVVWLSVSAPPRILLSFNLHARPASPQDTHTLTTVSHHLLPSSLDIFSLLSLSRTLSQWELLLFWGGRVQLAVNNGPRSLLEKSPVSSQGY